MPDTTKDLRAKNAQRARAKWATFEQLLAKKPVEKVFTVRLDGQETADVLFRAIGADEYDKLLTKHPPKPADKAEGATFNLETFAPALLAVVCVEPNATEAQWSDLWHASEWNRGELTDLFYGAVGLCNQGLDPGPTAAG